MHVIAAKAVCFKEALQPEFKMYQKQILKNSKALSSEFTKLGYRIVAGGTDTHLFLLDLTNKNITGKDAATVLDRANITVNKNLIPFDPRSPFVASGVRIGSPAITTRGMKEAEMRKVARLIDRVISDPQNESNINAVRGEVKILARHFPLYKDLVKKMEKK